MTSAEIHSSGTSRRRQMIENQVQRHLLTLNVDVCSIYDENGRVLATITHQLLRHCCCMLVDDALPCDITESQVAWSEGDLQRLSSAVDDSGNRSLVWQVEHDQ